MRALLLNGSCRGSKRLLGLGQFRFGDFKIARRLVHLGLADRAAAIQFLSELMHLFRRFESGAGRFDRLEFPLAVGVALGRF